MDPLYDQVSKGFNTKKVHGTCKTLMKIRHKCETDQNTGETARRRLRRKNIRGAPRFVGSPDVLGSHRTPPACHLAQTPQRPRFPRPRAYVKPPARWRQHAVGALAEALLHETSAAPAALFQAAGGCGPGRSDDVWDESRPRSQRVKPATIDP